MDKVQLTDWYSFYSKKMTTFQTMASLVYHWPYIWQICWNAKQNVLEIGCGRGIHSIFLSYFIPSVFGIDNNLKLVEMARKNNSRFCGRARFLRGNAFTLDFPARHFDVCYSQGFLEHFEDEEIRLLVGEQLRVARLMIASVPSTFLATKERGDERLMSIEDWRRILKSFETRMFYYGFKPREPNRIISFRNFVDIPKIMSIGSYKTQICILAKRAHY